MTQLVAREFFIIQSRRESYKSYKSHFFSVSELNNFRRSLKKCYSIPFLDKINFPL
jgi:hypothetical protein